MNVTADTDMVDAGYHREDLLKSTRPRGSLRMRLPGLALAWVVGCGGPALPETAVVTGRVTVDDQPVPAGQIRFYPTSGRAAMGSIIDGTYQLRTFAEADGAIVGNHRVAITAMETERGTNVPQLKPPPDATPAEIRALAIEQVEQGGGGLRWIVPQPYSDVNTSNLTAVVTPGENTIDFPITTK